MRVALFILGMKIFKRRFNRFLRLFGLMKIKRAEKLSTILHIYYMQCAINAVGKDFNVLIKADALSNGRGWWIREFIRLVNTDRDNINITTQPEFEEDKAGG